MKPVDNQKIIGLDLDGVIINHAPLKMKLAKKFGFKLKPEETPSEIIKSIVERPVLDKLLQILYHDPRFFKTTSLMPGVKLGLLKLQKNNLPFVLISRRREPISAIEALKHHGLWPKFFNEKNAFFVVEPEDKNIKAREMGVTHYADDDTGILEKLVDVKNRFLFDNLGAFSAQGETSPLRGGENTIGYTRVKSWKELIEHFLK